MMFNADFRSMQVKTMKFSKNIDLYKMSKLCLQVTDNNVTLASTFFNLYSLHKKIQTMIS